MGMSASTVIMAWFAAGKTARVTAELPPWFKAEVIKLALPFNDRRDAKEDFVIIGDLDHKPDEGLNKIAFDTIKRFVEGAQHG